MSNKQQIMQAFDVALFKLTGALRSIHPDIRQYAIDLIERQVASTDLIETSCGAIAKVIVALQTNYDCNGIDARHWTGVAPIYKEFGDLMIAVGLAPNLIWPSHDGNNAPAWAVVTNPPSRGCAGTT